MSVEVVGKFFFASRNDTVHLARTREFLKGKGLFSWLEFDDELTDKEIIIELKEEPRVIKSFAEAGHIRKTNGRYKLYVVEMWEKGILFYVPYPNGDDLMFIPYHNVQCIHTFEALTF